jgi:hypothetical protein
MIGSLPAFDGNPPGYLRHQRDQIAFRIDFTPSGQPPSPAADGVKYFSGGKNPGIQKPPMRNRDDCVERLKPRYLLTTIFASLTTFFHF